MAQRQDCGKLLVLLDTLGCGCRGWSARISLHQGVWQGFLTSIPGRWIQRPQTASLQEETSYDQMHQHILQRFPSHTYL